MSFEPNLQPEADAGPREGPGAHTPPQLEDAGCRDSELPVIHLQVFQVCHQAEDSTVILRLAALEVGDRSDWAEQLRQSLRSTSLDLRQRQVGYGPYNSGPKTPQDLPLAGHSSCPVVFWS